ncbi:MAG: hypothetical protein A2293_02795 [Elusimicrobia bacterium RIFOXYB2_FULL_49_7]|nr:MAG: hypothetical protein A2293_02795 [Elusimicrobia bacterium RIFOXYB2_FULL_49_7]
MAVDRGFLFIVPAIILLLLLLYRMVWIHRRLAKTRNIAETLYDALNTSFKELFQDLTEGHDLDWTREILYESPPRKGDLDGLISSFKGLLNRQVSLFQSKNRRIRELNERILVSKKQLEAVFDILNDGLCIVDSDFRIVRLNRAFAEICGQEIKNLLGAHSHEVFPGLPKNKLTGPLQKSFETMERTSEIKFEINAPDGKRYFSYTTFPISKEGRVEYVVELFRNVTVEKKISDQLIRSANLATIGTMITGIAHEMNNPLSGISGCAQNMLSMPEVFGMNDKGMERVRDIVECANRAETILKDLLDLSRKKESQFVITNIVPVIEKSLKSIHLNGFDRIRSRITMAPEVKPLVNCDPARLMQVFINLLTNASLSVLEKEGRVPREKDYVPRIDVLLGQDGSYLTVAFTDNGIGISSDKISYIFDPFYSTRPPGQGTGLGLSICSKIMLEHSGRLYAESADNKTTFTVELPLHKPL